MITLGCITLAVFVLRFVVFTFRESPKFLLSKGFDAHALDVLYSISKFNGTPEPRLTFRDFQALNHEHSRRTPMNSRTALIGGAQGLSTGTHAKRVAMGGFNQTFGHLRELVANKRNAYLFVVMAVS